MKDIYLLDVNGILVKDSGAYQRQAIYFQAARKRNLRLNIITQDNFEYPVLNGEFKIPVIKFKSKLGLIKILFKLSGESKRESTALALIAGDPWKPFWASLICKILNKNLTRIQIQIHANIFSNKWLALNWKNIIKYQLTQVALRYSDQIRLVSDFQLKQISRINPKSANKCFVAPVPLMLNAEIKVNKKRQKANLAFVGRMEADRGLEKFTEIVKLLQHSEFQFNITLIGSGAKLLDLVEQLKIIKPMNEIKILGQLSPKDLSESWQDVNLLISTAPSESYGRTIREALCHKVPVLALEFEGNDALKDSLERGDIDFFSNTDHEKVLIQKVRNLLQHKVTFDYINFMCDKDNDAVEQLVGSWLNLANDEQLYES